MYTYGASKALGILVIVCLVYELTLKYTIEFITQL